MTKRFYLFLLAILFVGNITTAAVVAPVTTTAVDPALSETFTGTDKAFSAEDFLALTPKKIRETTGRKLKLKESIALKMAQKRIKKQMKAAEKGKLPADDKPKSQIVALILALVIGTLGIHRFYLGYTTIGIIQILTLGGCGVWTLIDIIRIVLGDLGPADGSAYDPEL